MTLRLRLVVGLVILVLTGLAIFGFSTYALYSRTQYQRLDLQLRNSLSSTACKLFSQADLGGPDCSRGGNFAPYGTYAALIGSDGTVAVDASNEPIEFFFSTSTPEPAKPDLPDVITDPGPNGRLLTTGSLVGSGDWRVSVTRALGGGPNSADRPDVLLVVAIPTKEVTDSLRRLILIEGSAAGGLLVILAMGSWFILRRGLRPLEQMATSTRTITAGGLSHRVEPSDGRSEVGQLGLALNTMLSELEIAFKERDATELRLRQFLADASHELRTPLTSIQGFAELFRLGADHPDLDLPIVMRRIEQESARMKVLVDDLLMLARLDQPRPTEPGPVDLAVLCADACSDAHAVAPARRVSLIAPEPVVINGDSNHLRQAISNLVTNAVKHTPDGTAIEVSACFVDRTAVVTVRDHGEGLDPTALEHAFDRFWQADSARVGQGSGLGLAIVESIAHEHGGTVSVANSTGADGEVDGAVFTFQLPLELPRERPAERIVQSELPASPEARPS
ncbi:MAG: integral rane sensor signal transduction histidine kinase [Ilumatobacteraceae bacterium]|nr:integral rane sensor signal transduction histidine kinase [Ilumatobacteraceae bacterium]MCU1386826.1 integral rane sensor signal transduction histidine kinase [Ilumatobacteraceae bacterium]